ncbi:MAG: NfeD family protein [Spirochaetia bacterium]
MIWSASSVFLFLAIFGGIVSALRFLLYFFGVAGESAIGFEDDGGVSNVGSDTFNVLNLHTIAAFCLIGGLVGYGSLQANLSLWIASLAATGSGVLAVFVLAKVFLLAKKLHSDGTIKLSSALGKTGTVYLTIRPQTGGQIQIRLQERLMTLNAYTHEDVGIPTGELVRVIDIEGENLIVESLTEKKSEQNL